MKKLGSVLRSCWWFRFPSWAGSAPASIRRCRRFPPDRRHRRRRRGRRWRYRPRTERLAGAGRHGSRLDLGPWQLCRAGLDRGLAASRSHLRPRRLGRLPNSASLTSNSAPKIRPSSAAGWNRSTGTTPTMPRRTRSRIEPVRARAFEACLAHFSDVFMNGNAAYAIPAGSVSQPRAHAAVRRLHLLDRLVGRRRTARRHRLLHEQLAVRAAGRQSAHRRQRAVDRRQHHHAAGRHLRDGLVVRLAKGGRARGPASRTPIRWAAGPPRRRSARRSSTSGSSRR